MREFCTAGPIVAEQHYFVPPLERLDLPHVMELIDGHKYFLLHAPRQTGKTTCLRALVEELNRGGKYRAVYCNIEGAQAIRENVTEGIRSVLSALSLAAQRWLNDPYVRGRFRPVQIQLTLLERLIEAYYGSSKLTQLRAANIEIEKLRHLMRVCAGLRYLSLDQLEFATRALNEIGGMTGGWIRQQEAKGRNS